MLQASRWDRIIDTSPRQMRILLDDALGMLADDLLERLEPTLLELGGDDWPRTLAEQSSMAGRRAQELSPRDVTAYVDLLRSPAQGWEPCRSRLRHVLTRGQPYGEVDRLVDGVLDVRHTWAHRKVELDVDMARAHLGAVARLADKLRLAGLSDYRALQANLVEVATGRVAAAPTSEQVEAMGQQNEALGRELQEIRQLVERRDADLEALTTRAAEAEEDARRARSAESDLRRRQVELEQAVRPDGQVAAEAAQRERASLAAEQASVAEQRRSAEAEARAVAQEREALETTRAQVALREAELDEKDRALQVRLTEAQATVTRDELLDRLQRIVARTQETVEPTSQPASGDELPTPGAPWPYRRGAEVWTLSKQRRSFDRVNDDVTLADLVGPRRAGELVASFLAVRPTGGRAWVDVDGDAATYVEGQLVYLGRLGQSVDATDAALGEPVVDVSGRRYTVGRGSIKDGGGTTLASTRGAQVSRSVLDRLLQVRPKGGVYRVSREGRAITYVDGRWVLAGTVRAAEWFPGHLA